MRLFLSLILAACAFAQVPGGSIPDTRLIPRYQAIDAHSLSSNGEEFLTVQNVANGPQIGFRFGSVYCAAACTVQFQRNTTGNGSNPPIKSLNATVPASAVVWLGTPMSPPGTTLASYVLTAGQTIAFDLTGIFLGPGGGTSQSFSIGVLDEESGGNIQIVVEWTEVH